MSTNPFTVVKQQYTMTKNGTNDDQKSNDKHSSSLELYQKMKDYLCRASWKLNSSVQIYINTISRWGAGKIVDIITDTDGKWLKVKHNSFTVTRQVKRDCSYIRSYYYFDNDCNNKLNMEHDLRKLLSTILVFGYIRIFIQNKLKHLIIPKEILFMCLEYYLNCSECICEIRQKWDHGDEVEIFSNAHQEWNLAEIVDIFEDDEGEWLHCIYVLANGEAMSKQVRRFSSDIRPVYHDCRDNKEPVPIWSGWSPVSKFRYPATGIARRMRKLIDIEETEEKDQYVMDYGSYFNKNSNGK